jgi:hypothetical protein
MVHNIYIWSNNINGYEPYGLPMNYSDLEEAKITKEIVDIGEEFNF